MLDLDKLKKCTICPHKCGIDRTKYIGRCKSCISGEKGSGTIFFSNCNLNCVFCQNYEISQQGRGREIEIEELAEIMLKQQEKGVENINFVTPTSYSIQIKEAIIIAKENGLKIPIVYNTNGYENVETLRELEGLIDIYLPDLKYYYNSLGKKVLDLKWK